MSAQREPSPAEFTCVNAIKKDCKLLIPRANDQEVHMICNIAMTHIMNMNDARTKLGVKR